MELRHLRYLVALSEYRNFTRAASATHVTQSTLSHQIRKVEEELGVTLFLRTNRDVFLTPAGEALLPGVKRALAELNEAICKMKGCSKGARLVIAVLTGSWCFSRRILPDALLRYRAHHEQISVTVKETMASLLPDVMRAQDSNYDLIIGDIQQVGVNMRFEPLYCEKVGLLVPKGHRFALRKRIRMVELHGEAVVLPGRAEPARVVFEEGLEAVMASPLVVTETNLVEGALEIARRNKIITLFLNNMRNALSLDDSVYVAIEDPSPERTLGIIWAKNQIIDPSVRSLADMIRNSVREFGVNRSDALSIRSCLTSP